MRTVLVTGGSGFVGSHIVQQLLAGGHQVRTTLRSLDRESGVRAMLGGAGGEGRHALTVFAADLESDDGWAEAAAGCDYVLHVASPFPAKTPKHEDELIVPAREGTLRVLRAAAAAGVRRVVMTSSFGAIGYGHSPQRAPFDETSWTNVDAPGISAYIKSKTLAERAAWAFVAGDGGGMELAVVNPVGVFGPLLGSHLSASTSIVKLLMDGGISRCPRLSFGVVDVRDVADLHIRAMTDPAAAGERFLAVAGDCMSMLDIARLLSARLGKAAEKVPTSEAPDWLLRLLAPFVPTLRAVLPDLGKVRPSSGEKARRRLGWAPRSNEEAIIATAESLLRHKLLADRLA